MNNTPRLFKSLLLVAAISLISSLSANAETPIPDELAVRAIIGEASGEGFAGMKAVACAIRNRGTLKGVYGVNARHVDKQPQWVWKQARKAWAESAREDVTKGATHWESKDFKVPTWAKGMAVTLRLGRHIFYRPQ